MDAGDLVGGEIVHHHDVARAQRRRQAMAEIGEECCAIHRPVDHPGCCDPIDPKGGDEGERFPMAVRDGADQALADRTAAIEPRHLRGEAGLVQKHQAFRVDPGLDAPPGLTPLLHVRPVLLRRMRGLFLSGCGSAREKCADSSC